MAIVHFLAMTGSEFHTCPSLPPKIAWMACHFSPYATGLSNIPKELPAGSMLILNDRTPICGHDPEIIAGQLFCAARELCADSILLDFQRPGEDQTARLVRRLVDAPPCPVGVSELYAPETGCFVFLPPVPHQIPLEEYLRPWHGREIWLETERDAQMIEITDQGSRFYPCPIPEHTETVHFDAELNCRYSIRCESDRITFSLWRTEEDIIALLEKGKALGVTQGIGLYQSWRTADAKTALLSQGGLEHRNQEGY